MIFNSFEFLIFLPVVLFVYFAMRYRYRWAFLLAVSYFFYMYWSPKYIILVIISSLIDYFAALLIFKNRRQKHKFIYLIVSIVANLSLLVTFKYANFFVENVNMAFNFFNINNSFSYLEFILPVGISFYTFQTMSYTIDVYRKKIVPEKHLGYFALYVTFFPQLVAGPIERADKLLSQLKQKVQFSVERLSYGLQLILYGFFQKVVIADNLSLFVNEVFKNPTNYFGWDIILAVFFFAFQIYCDFAGYTNIAIGTAHILGVKLMKNFKQPYFSHSIRSFWKNWHISLSTWFRDYLYLSLGGNRGNFARWIFAVIFTFLISGFWHGARWTFIVWGIIHATFYLFEYLIKFVVKKYFSSFFKLFTNKIAYLFRTIFTFVIVCFAWIFFRAQTIEDAFVLIKNSLHLNSLIPSFSFDNKGIVLCFSLISLLLIIDKIERKEDIINFIQRKNTFIRFIIYYFFILALIGIGNWGLNEFIYFQF